MLCDAGQPGTQPRVFPGPMGAFPPKVLPSTEAGPPGVRCAVRNDSMSQQRMLCLHSEDVEIFFKENSCYLSAQNICVDMRNMEVVWPFGEGANSYFLRGRERTEEAVGWGGVGRTRARAPLPTKGGAPFSQKGILHLQHEISGD